MSVTKPATRTEFKNYCLRRLGQPVIAVNVDPVQVDDCVDDAIRYFQLYHYNGSSQVFLPLTVTQDNINNKSFPVDDSIISITRLLESTYLGTNQFSAEWQLIANSYPYSLKGDGLLNYSMAMSYIDSVKSLISSKAKPIQFNLSLGTLYLNINWDTVKVGTPFVVEATMALDPNDFPAMWNDQFLKKYATALIKKQWGENLRKLRNVQLIGGVTIDAEGILQEALEEIKELEESLRDGTYSDPIDFFMA